MKSRAFSGEALERFTRAAAETLSQARLAPGRGLLEIDRRGLDEERGCSGAVHYASVWLQVDWNEARREAEEREVVGEAICAPDPLYEVAPAPRAEPCPPRPAGFGEEEWGPAAAGP